MNNSIKQKNIPSNWIQGPIEDFIIDIKDGGTPSRGKPEYFGGGIPWVVIKDIKPKIFSTNETLSQLGVENSSAKVFPAGTVILSFGATIGEVGIAEVDLATKQGISGVLPDIKKMETKYLYFLLQSQKKLLNQMATGSTIKEIRPNVIKKINVLVPPIPEQNKIVDILSSVDEEVERNKLLIKRYEDLKIGILTDFLNSKTEKNKFRRKKLEDLCNFTTGKLNSNKAVEGGEYPFFTCSKETYAIDQYSFDCEAILLAGNNAAGIYSVKHYKGKFDAYQRTYVITIKNEEELDYVFLKEILNTKLNLLKNMSLGSTTKFLTIKLLYNIEVNIPSITEQKRIAKILLLADQNIAGYKILKEKFIELKKGLMSDLLNGKVRTIKI